MTGQAVCRERRSSSPAGMAVVATQRSARLPAAPPAAAHGHTLYRWWQACSSHCTCQHPFHVHKQHLLHTSTLSTHAHNLSTRVHAHTRASASPLGLIEWNSTALPFLGLAARCLRAQSLKVGPLSPPGAGMLGKTAERAGRGRGVARWGDGWRRRAKPCTGAASVAVASEVPRAQHAACPRSAPAVPPSASHATCICIRTSALSTAAAPTTAAALTAEVPAAPAAGPPAHLSRRPPPHHSDTSARWRSGCRRLTLR